MGTKTVITLSDGTKCYSGPNCRKHGTRARAEGLTQQISDLLASQKEPAVNSTPETPEWWAENKWREPAFQRNKQIFESLGATAVTPVSWHKTADLKGYVEVTTDSPDTKLIVHVDSAPKPDWEPKYYCRSWLYKNGQPVAMLKFSTYPDGYVPKHGAGENVAVINTVEVHPDHSGKGHAMDIIRETEKNILGGRLIHSGGSYTPEGRAALGGKLPFTQEVLRRQESEKRMAKWRGVEWDGETVPPASFDSMRFVGDWDSLHPETTWDEEN